MRNKLPARAYLTSAALVAVFGVGVFAGSHTAVDPMLADWTISTCTYQADTLPAYTVPGWCYDETTDSLIPTNGK